MYKYQNMSFPKKSPSAISSSFTPLHNNNKTPKPTPNNLTQSPTASLPFPHYPSLTLHHPPQPHLINMKFTSAIIALSAVAALVQAEGPVGSAIQQAGAIAPVGSAIQQAGTIAPDAMGTVKKVDDVVGNVVQKRDGTLDPFMAALAPAAGTLQGLGLGGQSASADAGTPNEPNAVHVKRGALGALGAPGSLAEGLLPKLGGSGARLQKRGAKVNVDAEIKAAVKACLDAVADVKVKAELVAQVLAKVKANLGVKITADLEAKLLGKSFRANCRTSGSAFLAHHCFLYSLAAFL